LTDSMTLSLSIYVVDNRGLKVILRKRECWDIKVCDIGLFISIFIF
jgi:hypothetical protein